MKKYFSIILTLLLLILCGCSDSADSGEKKISKKEWVDIRGTETMVQSADGVKICVYVPNGVSAVNHKDSLTIKFEDFDDFSNAAVKHPIDYKVGVSSVFITPESSASLESKKTRLLSFGDSMLFNIDGFEVYESKLHDERMMLSIINIERSIGIRFATGKLIREKYDRETYLTKIITEISDITNNCTND